MKEVYNDNSLAENKVLILYTLNKINRDYTDNDLFKIILAVNDINYFYFRDILMDLVSSKLVATYTKENQTFYEITTEGKNSLELTIDVLPGILKLKADNVFKNEIVKIVNEDSISAEYIPEDEKNYTVKCKIIEKFLIRLLSFICCPIIIITFLLYIRISIFCNYFYKMKKKKR